MEPKNPEPNNSSNQENFSGKSAQPTKSGTVRNGRGFDVPLDSLEKHLIQYKKENPDADEDDLNYEKNDFIDYYEDPSQMSRIQNEAREKAEKAFQRALKNEKPLASGVEPNESSSVEINTNRSEENFTPQNKEKIQEAQSISSDNSTENQTTIPKKEPTSSSKKEFIDDPEYAQQLMMLRMGKITQKDLNEYRDLYGSSKPVEKNIFKTKKNIKDFSSIPDQKIEEKPDKIENIKDFENLVIDKKDQKNTNITPRLSSLTSTDSLINDRVTQEEILSPKNQKIVNPEIVQPVQGKEGLSPSLPAQTTLFTEQKPLNPVSNPVKNEINNISKINNEIGGNKFEEKNFLSQTRLNQYSGDTLFFNTQNSLQDFTTKLITNIQDLSSRPTSIVENKNQTNNSEIKTGELKNEQPSSFQNIFSDQKTENANYMSSIFSTLNEIVGNKLQQLSTNENNLTNIYPSITNMGGFSSESSENLVNNFSDLSEKLSVFSNLNNLSSLQQSINSGSITSLIDKKISSLTNLDNSSLMNTTNLFNEINPGSITSLNGEKISGITNLDNSSLMNTTNNLFNEIDSGSITSLIDKKISSLTNLDNSSLMNTANTPFNEINSGANFSENNNLKSITNSSIFPNNFFNRYEPISAIVNKPNLPTSNNQKTGLLDINTINPFTSEIIRLNKIRESMVKTNESKETVGLNSTNSFSTNEVNTNLVETTPVAMLEQNTAVQTPQLMREVVNSAVIPTINNSPEQSSSLPPELSSEPTRKELPAQQSNIPPPTENKSEEPNMSTQMLGGLSSQIAALTSVVREISTKLSYLDEDTNLSFK